MYSIEQVKEIVGKPDSENYLCLNVYIYLATEDRLIINQITSEVNFEDDKIILVSRDDDELEIVKVTIAISDIKHIEKRVWNKYSIPTLTIYLKS
jgi:hypothetical protein